MEQTSIKLILLYEIYDPSLRHIPSCTKAPEFRDDIIKEGKENFCF